ncbi:hypothetical protein [Leptospira levettii]|uniref:hypothetical protein n=1 Tax=Leptospira levettii TaxID=2023178 RepID=UPI0014384453|nr:hypothetical protein [Leptospira levettii]
MTNKIFITLLLSIFISNCKSKESNDDLTTFLFLQLATQPTSTAVVSTFAGQATSGLLDGTGTAAKFKNPNGIAFDSAGNMYVADTGNHCIRKITSAGVVTVFAGSDTGVSGLTNATGTAARFNEPFGIVVDSAGNVYVGDSINMLIRKITSAGVVTTLAGGNGGVGAVDGTGAGAKFDQPKGLAIDSADNIYVADSQNDAIRKVTSAGVVTTLAGSSTGLSGYVNASGTAARFTQPIGITLDSSGNLYVSDSTNSAIRKVTGAGVVTSIAGAITRISGFVDGIGFNSRFNQPYGIATDGNGHLFVGDYGNNAIRKIVP